MSLHGRSSQIVTFVKWSNSNKPAQIDPTEILTRSDQLQSKVRSCSQDQSQGHHGLMGRSLFIDKTASNITLYCISLSAGEPNSPEEWLQYDLGSPQVIYGVVTRGRADHPQWVTQYKLAYANEEEANEEGVLDIKWLPYTDVLGNVQVSNLMHTPCLSKQQKQYAKLMCVALDKLK